MQKISVEICDYIDKCVIIAVEKKLPKSATAEFLTLNEAAAHLKVSSVHIWQLRKDKKLTAIKSGKKVLFQKSEIDRYIKSNREGTL